MTDERLEQRGDVWCVVDGLGGVRPATPLELQLWQRISELERDKENVREWTRKHRNLIFYVAETHSIPDFMLEELADD